MFQQATHLRTPLRRLSCSPGNRAVSDELAPWTSLSMEETFRRRLRAATHFMSLLKS